MTTIRYFVPEDGDSEDHPNIFLMPKSSHSGFSPRLREIKENFPMPGTYHFRFKSALIPGSDREKNAVSVWMDCVNDDQHVGVWRNTIVAKVTRINMEDDEDDDFSRQNRHVHAAPSPVQRAPIQQAAPKRNMAPPDPAPVPVPSSIPASGNLLGFDDHKHPTAPVSNGSLIDVHTHTAPSTGEGSLLDMNGPTSYNSNTVHGSSSHDDFLGMTSTPVTTAPPVSAPAPIPPAPAPSSYGMPRPNAGAPTANKAFDTFSNKAGPFGGLEWN